MALPIVLALLIAVWVLLGAILWLSWWAERRVLSPQAMILSMAKARRPSPEFTEAMVAREFERLLREAQRV